MAFKIPRLESLPTRVQLCVLGGIVIALLAACYAFYFRDAMETRSAIQAEVVQLETSTAQAKAIEMQIARFDQELKKLDERLAVLRAILPDQKETPEVLRSVQQMAASSNLRIIKFQPQAVVAKTFHDDWPIQIEVQGHYDALGLFFEKISQATRILNVENIAIKGLDGSTDAQKTLQAVCTATTFVFRDDLVTPKGQ
jgi:type IV pilus assembly protein PilO